MIRQETTAREALEKTLDERLVRLGEAQKREEESIERKIERRMKKVIDLAASKSFEATKQKEAVFSRISELEEQNKQLLEEIKVLKGTAEANDKEILIKNSELEELRGSFRLLVREKDKLDENFKALAEEKKKVDHEVLEMRAALQGLSDLKDLLNRYTSKRQPQE